jgi:hypothetical protein
MEAQRYATHRERLACNPGATGITKREEGDYGTELPRAIANVHNHIAHFDFGSRDGLLHPRRDALYVWMR